MSHHNRRISRLAIVLSLSALSSYLTASAFADLMVYPAKGQSAEQQVQDQQQCNQWAIDQSGVDPATLSSPGSSGQQQQDRKVLRGAAAGAAVGGLGGSLGGEFGKGAAAGAAVGAVAGGVKQRRERKTNESMNQQQQAQNQQLKEKYSRAYGACLEGRGYTVK